MFSNFNVTKCETQVRLCHARIKLQKNKRTIAVKQMRKDIADLLRTGKQEYARIRVEGVIRENLLMQAYEIMELYLELLAVRVQLIAKTKEIPRDMVEAISSIIYAAQRISDINELVVLRNMFAQKYGKEYVAEASHDATCRHWQVNTNLIRCLLVEPPQAEEKLQMLSDIAQEHGVEWDLSAAAREMLPPGAHIPMPGMAPTSHPAHPPSLLVMPPPTGGLGPAAVPQIPPSMPGGAVDPAQAAAAAAAAAAHARAMAEWAQQVASQYAQGGGAPPPPPQAWPANGTVPGPSGGVNGSGSGGGGGGSGSAGGGGGRPVPRTAEDIQKAYDAAVGPPSKPPNPYTDAPSAPSAPTYLPSVPPPAPPSTSVDPHMPQMPRPPTKVGPSTFEDECDELNKRLEALKRS